MLQGKKILIAGAGGLLGSRLTASLLADGVAVVAVDLSVDQVNKRLESHAQSCKKDLLTCLALDLNDETAVKDLFSSFLDLDGAVNCTYPRNKRYGAKMMDVTLADFNENVSLHLGSSFLFMQQCAMYFQQTKRNFSLVNVSSIYGVVAPKFDIYDGTQMTMPVEYAAIKSAVIHLSKYLVKFVGDSDFRSNCISPGGIFDHQPEEFLKRYNEHTLGKGMLAIDDLFGTLKFLLSDDAKYINGQNIIVDDGFCL